MSLSRYKPKALLQAAEERRSDQLLETALKTREGLKWRRSAPCDATLYDAGAAQIGSRLYVFGGYIHLDSVSNLVRVFDLDDEKWLHPIEAPAGFPNSHSGIATDGTRYIYCASGQLGPQCSPAVPHVFVLDTDNGCWSQLPALPEPRYGGTMQLWRGHLHFIGGAEEDRWTPSADHWRLPVEGGVALARAWQAMTPIPIAGMHRGSGLSKDCLFVFGGQQGDFKAIPGDPDCKCTGLTQETYLPECFRLDDPEANWTQLADMPIPASHTDFSVVERDGTFFLFGGQTYKHPEQFYMRLTDAVQAYDATTNRWKLAGHLPYRLKLPVIGTRGSRIFLVGGQRGRKDGDRPGSVISDVWTADLTDVPSISPPAFPSVFHGKSILLVSPSLGYSGAPLLLLETARQLVEAGATVRLVSLADDTSGWTVASRHRIPVLPPEMASHHAATADLVIANTVSQSVMEWVATATAANPGICSKLICWVHEIDVEHFMPAAAAIRKAALQIFDSKACLSVWREVLGDGLAPVVVNPGLSPTIEQQRNLHRVPFPRNPGSQDVSGLATRAEIRAHLGVAEKDFLILSLATVESRKGQKLLVRTVADLAAEDGLPLKLLLVGFRNWRQKLKFLARLRPRDWRVLSTGRAYTWQTEISGFYRAADAFVTNTQGLSKDRGECFGRVTVEAMAMGTVALGTAAGGTLDIIDDGETGLLFPTGAEGQKVLAGHLRRLVSDPGFAQRLSKSGKERVAAEFGPDCFWRRFEAAVTSHITL